MRYGVCADFSKAVEVKKAGFDYIELPINKIGVMSDEDFEKAYSDFLSVGIKAEACSLLLPKTMVVIGPQYNKKELDDYLTVAFSRMKKMGIKVVSFGSGKSRFVPSGVRYTDAYKELVEVTKHIVDRAKEYDVVVAIEPLNRGETNLINFLTEGSALASLTGASLLADAFHIRKENEPISDILLTSPIAHAHIATLDGRRYPLSLNDEVLEFIKALKDSGYDDRLSIEGKTDDISIDGPKALEVLKKAYKEA